MFCVNVQAILTCTIFCTLTNFHNVKTLDNKQHIKVLSFPSFFFLFNYRSAAWWTNLSFQQTIKGMTTVSTYCNPQFRIYYTGEEWKIKNSKGFSLKKPQWKSFKLHLKSTSDKIQEQQTCRLKFWICEGTWLKD